MSHRVRIFCVVASALVAACSPAAGPSTPIATTPGPVLPSAPTRSAAPSAAVTSAAAPAGRQRVQVLSVTDGDTIRVSIDGRSMPVRYIGIDTPETVDPRKDAQCFGKQAADANKTLVEGKTVELEKDVSETDMYDRLLRYVYVEITGRGMVMANEELVQGGFARSSSYPPDVKYQEKLRLLETDARNAGSGLWGSACAAATTAPTAAPTTARTASPTTAPLATPVLSVVIAASRYGFVSATTLLGASCAAQARLPSGTISSDQDLKVTMTAAADGMVTWNYGVASRTNPGTGTHTVTCSLAGVTRSASAPFTVN